MNNYSEDIVKYSISGDGARVKEAIQGALANKIMAAMETKKAEVAQAMFNTVSHPKQEVADTFVASAEKEPTEESTINEISPELARKARDKAQVKRFSGKVGDDYHGQRQSDKFDAYAQRKDVEKKTGIKSPAQAMKYYREKGRAPDGWGVTVIKGRPVKAFKK